MGTSLHKNRQSTKNPQPNRQAIQPSVVPRQEFQFQRQMNNSEDDFHSYDQIDCEDDFQDAEDDEDQEIHSQPIEEPLRRSGRPNIRKGATQEPVIPLNLKGEESGKPLETTIMYIQDVIDDCSVPDLNIGLNVPWQQSKSVRINFKSQSSEQIYQKAVIILIPLRLGNEKLNINYADKLKSYLSSEHCIGIIGGRPKHSLYFVGFQEDKLIHLDPHYCQDMVDVTKEDFPVNSFHCKSPRKLKSSKIDPSCCLGFYCATKEEFDAFVKAFKNEDMLAGRFTEYPIFTIVEGRSADIHTGDEMVRSQTPMNPFRQETYRFYNDDNAETEEEEFVIM